MRKTSLLIALSLSACSSLPDPTYAPPTEVEAKGGYIAGSLALADMFEGRPVAKASEFPNEAIATVIDRTTLLKELQIEGGILALRNIDPIDKVTVANCNWERIDPGNVDADARPLIGEHPPGAYFCKSDVYVTQNYGIKAKAATTGYFFKNGSGEWTFIGQDAHGFDRY